MRYRVRFLPDTVADREEIRVYLSQYYESTVNNFFSLLKKRIASLKDFPYSCPTYENDPDYRKLVVGEYLVFYVEVHRIFHSSRDIRRIIN